LAVVVRLEAEQNQPERCGTPEDVARGSRPEISIRRNLVRGKFSVLIVLLKERSAAMPSAGMMRAFGDEV